MSVIIFCTWHRHTSVRTSSSPPELEALPRQPRYQERCNEGEKTSTKISACMATLTWRIRRDGVAMVTASASRLRTVRRTVAVFTVTLSETVALLHINTYHKRLIQPTAPTSLRQTTGNGKVNGEGWTLSPSTHSKPESITKTLS